MKARNTPRAKQGGNTDLEIRPRELETGRGDFTFAAKPAGMMKMTDKRLRTDLSLRSWTGSSL